MNNKHFQKPKYFSTERTFSKEEKDQSLVFGIRAVIEAIRSGREINKILIQKGIDKELFVELKEVLVGKNYNLQYVPIEKLNKLTQQNHQGVIAFMSPVTYHDLRSIIDGIAEKAEPSCLLFLDRLTDVRNFGAIARTAECQGVTAVVIPARGSVQVTSDAVKTSAGALNRIPVCKSDNFKDDLFYAQQSGIRIVAGTEKTSNALYEVNLRGMVAIVMGSEEDGVSSDILKMADIKAKIPMLGEISSLNVGVATGMILYERTRQLLY
ncbi:MAG TPA: 23S rRNA (guanosine(2251)-2'-O)-methyltransferase RlmB [Crocinitomicaceae bacterium]|nr:23S rRNA (guanosine(2251)-2'-O)-methyltransferase RlmB [Crocinitomicaceae bacterium]